MLVGDVFLVSFTSWDLSGRWFGFGGFFSRIPGDVRFPGFGLFGFFFLLTGDFRFPMGLFPWHRTFRFPGFFFFLWHRRFRFPVGFFSWNNATKPNCTWVKRSEFLEELPCSELSDAPPLIPNPSVFLPSSHNSVFRSPHSQFWITLAVFPVDPLVFHLPHQVL